MKKITILLSLASFFFAPQLLFAQHKLAQPNEPDGIQWMSFEEAVKKNEKEQKKIFVDVYTSWCGWCKRLDATTFKDPKVVEYINKKFHPVKLDAETKDTIVFRDHQFYYHPDSRTNELAYSMMSGAGRMSYPTAIYLDETFSVLSPVPGYLTPDQIMPILMYFGENIYKTKKWEEYVNELNSQGGAAGNK